MKVVLLVQVIFGLFTSSQSQNVNINCNFLIATGLYSCSLLGVMIPDNENANIIIGGAHISPRNNADVQRVQVTNSNIPFIITQLFTTFPNIVELAISNGGLTRVQSNAFANAVNLRTASVANNQLFGTIHANAFTGALSLSSLQFNLNRIQSIHEAAFNGLTALQNLIMENNNIQNLTNNVFQPLTSLRVLSLSNNQLEIIDGRLLANNNQVTQLDLSRNRIDAIGRNFLDGFTGLLLFNANGNRCVNSFWIIGGTTTINTVRNGLETCFNNFIEAPEKPEEDVRRFVLELRGSLTIRNENGTEVITI